MAKPIYLDLTTDQRAVIRAAVKRLGGNKLHLWAGPIAVPPLVKEALIILNYPTLEDWVKSQERNKL